MLKKTFKLGGREYTLILNEQLEIIDVESIII